MRPPAARNSTFAFHDMTTTPSLRKLAGFDPDLLVNFDDAERVDVQRAWASRRAHLLTELDEPLHLEVNRV